MSGYYWADWVQENWYWLVLSALIVFAFGFYENWRREKLRRKLNDAGLATMMGDRQGAGGALDSFADAELPTSGQRKPPSNQA
jgi:hypothetical protein